MSKNSMFTLSGAVGLSFVHRLLELWRGLMDFAFVLSGMAAKLRQGNPSQAGVQRGGAYYTVKERI